MPKLNVGDKVCSIVSPGNQPTQVGTIKAVSGEYYEIEYTYTVHSRKDQVRLMRKRDDGTDNQT